MASPSFFGSAEFESLPISKNVKIFRKENDSIITIGKKESKAQALTIHLLGDTLIITTPTPKERHPYRLLYPPMPLSHIEIVERVSEKDIFELRLSPYKMLAITASDLKSIEFIQHVKSIQKKADVSPTQQLVSSGLSIGAEPALQFSFVIHSLTKMSINNTIKTSSSCNSETAAKQSFNAICRPTLFKVATSSWEKLAKCFISVFETPEKKWLSLNLEGSGVSLLNATICPTTKCERDTPTRIQLHIINGSGIPSRYLIKISTPEETNALAGLLADTIKDSTIILHNQMKSSLIVQPAIEWMSADHDKRYNTGLYIKPISKNENCYIKNDNDTWTSVGPVSINLLLSGPAEDILVSTRLIISALCSRSLEFLNIELENERCSLRMEGPTLLLRVYYTDRTCDFKIEDNGQLEKLLMFELEEADILFKSGSAKWNDLKDTTALLSPNTDSISNIVNYLNVINVFYNRT